MPVIALTQGMGSLSKDIAVALADELGLTTLQHEVADKVAEKMHVSRSLINRLRTGKAGTIERLRSDRTAMALYSAEEVLDAAAKGNVVIRGWGATQLLRPVPHIPCIRIMRPFDQRVKWLMDEIDTDDRSVAEAEIRRSDEANATRMQDQFGVTWNEPVLFDAVLNTDRMSVASCVQVIGTLLARPEFAETPESRALLHGLALSARVRATLRAHEETHGVDITIDSSDGRVTLSGIVASDDEKSSATQVSAGVAGVQSVDNQLRVMSRSKLFPSNRQ